MSRNNELEAKRNELAHARSRKSAVKITIRNLEKRIAELEAQPTLDEPPTRASFIRFDKQFVKYGLVYQYGAIRAGGFWYLTGAHSPQGLTWDALTAFIEKDNVNSPKYRYFVGEYTEVYPT